MKKLLISASAIALFACSTPTKKYTYQIKFFPDATSSVESYNAVGLDGWQLINSRRADSGNDTIQNLGYECIFMKEVE